MSEILTPALLAEIRQAIADGLIPEITGIAQTTAQQAVDQAISSITSSGTASATSYTNSVLGTLPINRPAISPEPEVGPEFYTQ